MRAAPGEIKAGSPQASSQTVPVLLYFSSRRCRNIHYMHEEFTLAARIDPASPVPLHVSITSAVFLKVCNEAHTVLSFLPDSGLHDVKGQIKRRWSFCSFPALQLLPNWDVNQESRDGHGKNSSISGAEIPELFSDMNSGECRHN